MISLVELNDSNYEELSKITIRPNQEAFVKNFQKCIDYKKENPFLRIYGIMRDEVYIGVTAFARWDSNEEIPIDERWTWFDEFFIDVNYQGRGYARECVEVILQKIKEIYNPKFVVLSVRNDNRIAKRLYESLGFKYTGQIYDEENDRIIKREARATDELIMRRDY